MPVDVRWGVAKCLLILLLATSCRPAPPGPSTRAHQRQQADARASGGPERAEPLHTPVPGGRPRPTLSRNLFEFGNEPSGRGGTRTLPASPEGLPELPLPLASPPLVLIGIAADGERTPVRTAVLSVDGDLVLGKVGDRLAGRYRVTGVGEDSVDLVDQVGGRPLHLKWP